MKSAKIGLTISWRVEIGITWPMAIERPVASLDLSVRASNCLEAAKIETIGDLVRMTESQLLQLRSFGRTSLEEVKRKLEELGLSLGMKLDEPGGVGGNPLTASAGAPATNA